MKIGIQTYKPTAEYRRRTQQKLVFKPTAEYRRKTQQFMSSKTSNHVFLSVFLY